MKKILDWGFKPEYSESILIPFKYLIAHFALIYCLVFNREYLFQYINDLEKTERELTYFTTNEMTE